MNTIEKYPAKVYLGKHEGEKIYLSAPSWDCGWYWGFGYLGNKNCHYHVNGLTKHEEYKNGHFEYEFTNLFDGFKKHFGESLVIDNDKDLWSLCELFATFYSLKEAAEVLGRGGANYTSNPCKSIIQNKEEVKRINEVVLPAIFDEIYKILLPLRIKE